MKRLYFVLVLIMMVLISRAKNVHIIYFGDTDDANIGRAIQVDIRLMEKLVPEIKSVAKSEGYSCFFNKYVDSDCSPVKLRSVIENLSCKDDIVFFYYGGHGGRSHEDFGKFPRMCLGTNDVDQFVRVSDVMRQLKEKNPCLFVMVTDCCNSYYDRGEEAASWALESSSVAKTLQQLLFNQKGYVSITAASPGEYGWCNQNGSYLTISFLSFLESYNSKKPSNITWGAICKDIAEDVSNTTARLYNQRIISKSQNPVYEIGSVSDSNFDSDTPPITNDDNSYTIPDSSIDNPNDGVVYNSDDNNVNRDTPDSRRHVSRRHLGSLSNLIILVIVGGFLIFTVPCILKLEGKISTFVKLVGLIIILKAFIDFLF